MCGDSTVMATGAPATVVSGVGAANMVLRALRKPEYDVRKFPRQFVQFVETPYRRPAVSDADQITPENAALVAAQCQGCEEPACVADCPAHIDIPGVLRRMEAGNFAGAARELHLASPFGGLCGTVCPAGQLCERYCYRRSFAGQPVRIAELLRWVAGTASFDSGLRPSAQDAPLSATSNRNAFGARVAVLGGNPAGWTCAAYLALAGWQVDVLDSHDPPQPGWARRGPSLRPCWAWESVSSAGSNRPGSTPAHTPPCAWPRTNGRSSGASRKIASCSSQHPTRMPCRPPPQ